MPRQGALIDVFLGMVNGLSDARGGIGRGRGISPTLMGAFGLLAYKAVKAMGKPRPSALVPIVGAAVVLLIWNRIAASRGRVT